MNKNGLKVLVGVAIIAAGGAALTLDGDSGSSSAADRGPLFDGLLDRVNDVTRIEVTRGEESFAVTREGEQWGLESRGGYPVKFETVKQAIVGLANLEIVEAKTTKAEYYDRLGLGDYTDPEGQSKLVTLHADGGEVLASLVVGNTKWGGNTPSVYVRRDGEQQTWQCKGRLDVTDQPLAWVDKKILQLERDRIAEARVEHPGGELLTATRSSADETDWSVLETPPGRELSSPGAASSLATWLTYLSFDDVGPADSVDFAEAGPALECRTFDGLVVRVETTTSDDKTWARFTARYETPVEELGPAPPEEPEEPAEGAEGAEAGGDEIAADEGPSEDEVRAEAAELNEQLAAWAYALPSYKVTQLDKRVDDLLAPLPEPEEEAEAAETPDDEPTE